MVRISLALYYEIEVAIVFRMTTKPFQPKRVVIYAVGVEHYHSRDMGQIPTVPYAKDDAYAFVAAMRNLWAANVGEFEETTLIDAEASLTRIRDDLGYIIRGLDADDMFIFYYAGHGFHGAGGNRLTAADTNISSLENTTALVRDTIIKPLGASACEHSLLFIDACAADLMDGFTIRDAISSMAPAEYAAFLKSSEYSAVFLSCKPKEKSFSCHTLKHGVWTWHLIQALLGKADDAIDAQRWVTDTSLRNYLTTSVAKYVRDVMGMKGTQTPQAWITATGSVPIRHIPLPTVPPPSTDLSGFILVPTRTTLSFQSGGIIKQLRGFRSSNVVPTGHTSGARGFVKKLLAEDVANEGREFLKRIQDETGLRLGNLQVAEDLGAYGIVAREFDLEIDGSQDQDDPSRWQILAGIELGDAWASLGAELDRALGVTFKIVEVGIERPSQTRAELVDLMEDLKVTFGGTVTDESAVVSFSSADLNFEIDLSRLVARLRLPRKYSLLEALQEARRWHMPMAD
jgi:hypothetical protein